MRLARKKDAWAMKRNRLEDSVKDNETIARWRVLGMGLILGLLLTAGGAAAQEGEEPAAPRLDRTTQAQIKLLDGLMREERKDGEWAAAAEDGLKRAFLLDAATKREWREALRLEKEPAVGLRSVDCRTTVCRLEIGFDSARERETLLRMVVHAMPWSGESFGYVGDAESTTVVVYLAKAGEKLPRVDLWGDLE